MNVLGVILARKNSKGIVKKNHLKLNNKNLVQISIDNAKKSKLLSKIIFSTDDRVLQKQAIKLKVEAPFIRPNKLSTDKASSFSVLRHAIDWLKKNKKWKTDIVVLLQPTTPFRTGKIIDEVIKLLIKSRSDAAMTITDADYPPYWMLYKKNNFLKNIIPGGNKFTRRQDTPKSYKPAGMVYAIKKSLLYKIKGVLPQGKTVGYYVPPEIAINIDNINHYLLAKVKSKKLMK
jgi:CMP-N,N'-diacetyllegionaminic acid synthase